MTEHITRRSFMQKSGASLAAAALPMACAAGADETPAPKSTHTWLGTKATEIYSVDIDVRITDFPENADRRWLYYWSLQVNFTGHDEWSHGGFQWSGTREFRENNNKGVNWGGGSNWAGYGGIGVTNTPFTWELDRWYRYRVWRVDKKDDLRLWLFAVMDYTTGEEKQYGTVNTKSEWIKSAVVWMETGYGVVCDTPQARVEWRNPVIRSTAGESAPINGVTSYNGTCTGNPSTNQALISRQPLHWYQSTNTERTTPAGVKLWD